MVIELCVVQFWSEIILVISNQTRVPRSFDFEITRMISDQIALHSVQLPLLIHSMKFRGACKIFSVSDIRRNPNCDQIPHFLISLNTHSGAYLEFLRKVWLLIGKRTHNRGKRVILI